MGEQEVPSAIAVECGQSEEGFVAREAPKLASELETTLVLRAG